MQIRYVAVENFLGHIKEEVAIPSEGMFFLCGDSGAGKSSFIVDAVAYALYGSRATRSQKHEDLINNDNPDSRMQVILTLDLENNERITIERGIDAAGTPFARAYAPLEGGESVLLAETSSKVNRYVRQRLGGMTWQQFYAAFVARQSEISMLTNLRGKDRRELVHRMLGMRELEKASDEITLRLSGARSKLNTAQAGLGDKTLEDYEKDISDAQTDVTRAANESEAITSDIARLNKEVSEVEASCVPLRKSKEIHMQAQEITARINASAPLMQEFSSQMLAQSQYRDQAKDLIPLRSERDSVAKEVTQLRAKFEAFSELETSTVKLSEFDVTIKALADEVNSNDQDIETVSDLKARSAALSASVAQIDSELVEREETLQRMRDTGECATCLRPLGTGDHNHAFKQIETRIAELKASKEESASEIATIKDTKLPKAEAAESASCDRQNNLMKANAERAPLISSIERVRMLLGGMAKDEVIEQGKEKAATLESLKARIITASSADAKLDASLEERANKLREQVSADERALDALGASCFDAAAASELKDLEKQLQDKRSSLAVARGRKPDVDDKLRRSERSLHNAQNELTAVSAKLTAADAARSEVILLESLRTYLDGFTQQLANDIRPSLEQMGSEMIALVSDGKHPSMRIDEDYEIEVEMMSGAWVPAKLLSGGEGIRVNICLRLALTRLVSQRTGVPVKFLVMDEPLPSQDPDHVSRIMDLLSSLRSWYPQQFIISHVGDIKKSDELDFVMEFGLPSATEESRIRLSHA